MNRLYIYITIVICVFTIQSCDLDEIKSVATSGEMKIATDENVEPLMKDEVREFQRLNPEAKIVMSSGPTNNVITELLNRDTKFIVSTRVLNQEEKDIAVKNKMEITEIPFAIDAIGFIVNLKNPVTRVTSDDLRKILSGETKNWLDITAQDEEQNKEAKSFFNNSNEKIKLYIQRKNSSTHDYLLDSILKQSQYSENAVICSTTVQILESVRDNENAIGIVNMNWLSTGNHDTIDSTVKPLRVSKIWDNGKQDDYSEFHQGLIFNGKYPYRRTIYIITSEVGITLATGFITFLTKTDGQKIVLKNSLVPVNQPIRTIQIN
ncbi:MAG TPA: substrate-binding domain-containing protein [Ignavibacteria bacterium]|nr:substrate-binding domain-containing protein [Ignavibacteria bacterium]HQY50754.1 substrate-binding domain-containing protein [Ignavibacteria bacterium]HRA99057.1 substrate-binding domain-containing protein [Ignavibacteria bacterium]